MLLYERFRNSQHEPRRAGDQRADQRVEVAAGAFFLSDEIGAPLARSAKSVAKVSFSGRSADIKLDKYP